MGSRGLRLTTTVTYPEVRAQTLAVNQGLRLWIRDHFAFYDKEYIEPLVSNWQEKNKPKFIAGVGGGGNSIVGTWITSSVPFVHLNDGAIRKVRVERGKAPKTKARKFKSSGIGSKVLKKRGRKVFFGRSERKRKIRGRKWIEEIAKREPALLRRKVNSPEKGQSGVLFSMISQAAFVQNIDVSWVKFKLAGGDFKTPPSVYPLRAVRKRKTSIKARI